jgi:hypothetical protein
MTATFQVRTAVQKAVDWAFDLATLGEAIKAYSGMTPGEMRTLVPLSPLIWATLNNATMIIGNRAANAEREAILADHKAAVKALGALILGAAAPSMRARQTGGDNVQSVDFKSRAAGERDEA